MPAALRRPTEPALGGTAHIATQIATGRVMTRRDLEGWGKQASRKNADKIKRLGTRPN